MDSLSSLSSALSRMLEEPADKQHAAAELNRFIVQNYLMVAHIAALRVLFQRHREGLPREAANAALEKVFGKAHELLASAKQELARSSEHELHVVNADEEAGAIRSPSNSTSWSGWPFLQRRAKLLYGDASQLAQSSAAVGNALKRAA